MCFVFHSKLYTEKKKGPNYNKWLAAVVTLLLVTSTVFGVFFFLQTTDLPPPPSSQNKPCLYFNFSNIKKIFCLDNDDDLCLTPYCIKAGSHCELFVFFFYFV